MLVMGKGEKDVIQNKEKNVSPVRNVVSSKTEDLIISILVVVKLRSTCKKKTG